MKKYDIAIIGAGAWGCAIARKIKGDFRAKLDICVLEKNSGPGEETSSRNSGILHAGIHENPQSWKGYFSDTGSKLVVKYAEDNSIPLTKDRGMLIVLPWSTDLKKILKELQTFKNLRENAAITDIRFTYVMPIGIKRYEPHIQALGGIFVPDVCVIDSRAFVRSLAKSAELRGVDFFYNNPVIAIKRTEPYYTVITEKLRLQAKALINVAGLYADEIAALALGEKLYHMKFLRGEYYRVKNEKKKDLVQHPIFSVMPQDSETKGILIRKSPDGELYIGPNAKYVSERNDYVSEKTPPKEFLQTAKKLLPTLEEEDLEWSYSGIRPKISSIDPKIFLPESASGKKAIPNDFIISIDSKNPTLINCIGIDSPGLSSCLAAANHIFDMLPYMPSL